MLCILVPTLLIRYVTSLTYEIAAVAAGVGRLSIFWSLALADGKARPYNIETCSQFL